MSVPILTYHAVGDGPSPLWTSLPLFEAQIAAFAHSGWSTVPLAGLAARLEWGETLPERVLAITFDDGYESVHGLALSRLADLGFTATVFLVTGHCGGLNRWPGQPPSVPEAALLSWPQIERLAAAGWELGAHTLSHRPLPALRPAEAEEEIAGSRHEIERRTGVTAATFAYPYGAVDTGTKAIVRRHFQSAVGTRLGLVEPASDRFELERVDAWYLPPRLVPVLDSSLYRSYLRLRQGGRAVRRRWRRDWVQPAAAGGLG
ncbi:MAG TPA: polysaccharide deacetylase family protein [Thermoanaerobaculia bacterium]|nr:polysaccharide deacetylase family protein [Thermoanaerobaculia bacterium]